jgi:CubicO group peptidase (beta-lactamase class C family)
MKSVLRRSLVLFALVLAAPAAHADAELQAFVEQTLAKARDQHKLPGIAAVVQIGGKLEAEVAMGLRANGHPERVTTNDRWHIGSDTKAMTATLIARLVEYGKLRFEDTLADAFPEMSSSMAPAYREVTITQLLSHTAGLPPLTDDKELPPFYAAINGITALPAQRAAVSRAYLAMPPASKVGEFAYSNLGFIIAGAIAEARTGKSWEDLVREQIFAPLGIVNAGFGAPGTPGKVEQPQGHNEGRPLNPGSADADNPPAIGPAGTVHIALKDWLLFAQDQLEGVYGRGKLLKPATYRKLHTPVSGIYALGWGTKLSPDGAPLILAHSGSNGYWLADIKIMPKKRMIFLIAMNAGDEGANTAVQEINTALRERLKPFD